MLESVLIKYLIAADIVGSNVFAEVPKAKPNKYIVIQKTGSGRSDGINRATVAIQSYSTTSLLDAATINEAVKESLYVMAETTDIYRASLNSDYNYTSTNTKEYRYQAVFDFYY